MNKRPPKPRKKTSGEFWIEGPNACVEQIKQNPGQILSFEFRNKSDKDHFLSVSKGEWTLPAEAKVLFNAESPVATRCLVQIKMVDFDEYVGSLVEGSKEVLVALDHIEDPRNLGAIVRTAAFFGYRNVLVPQDRQVLLSQAAVSTAQGGFSVTNLVLCTNLSRSISKLKSENGFWVLGMDGKGEKLIEADLDFDRAVVVMGSEGKGMSENVKAKCDLCLAISGSEIGFDSLNVSVAAGIVLHEMSKNFIPQPL